MNKITYSILIAGLLAGCTTQTTHHTIREAADVAEVLKVLHNAKSLHVEGSLPGRGNEPDVALPLTIDSPVTIHAFEDIIRTCDFALDQNMTQTFRNGTTISTAIQVIIEVDNSVKFYLLADSLLVCRDMKTFATRREGSDGGINFAEQVGVLFKQATDRKFND